MTSNFLYVIAGYNKVRTVCGINLMIKFAKTEYGKSEFESFDDDLAVLFNSLVRNLKKDSIVFRWCNLDMSGKFLSFMYISLIVSRC